MIAPFRKAVHACSHPRTYKYFLDPDAAPRAWAALQDRCGVARSIAGIGAIELNTDALLLRAPVCGNPITVIRTRDCRSEHVDDFHTIIGFSHG